VTGGCVFLLPCVVFCDFSPMMCKPALRYIFFAGMILFIAVFSTPGTATAGSPASAPLFVETISITASPMNDRQGNFVGVTIPLKRAGQLFLLEGTIDNISGNFILDTGASGLVLNTTYFRNAIAVDDEEGGGVTGSTAAVARINVKHLIVSDMSYSNVSADVTPLGHLETRRGIKILGLFGMSLLKNLEMVIDLRNNELQIYKLDKNGSRLTPPSPAMKYDIIQKIEEFRNILFVKAVIGGRVLDFCLDTGAESNVLSIDAHKKVMETVTIKRRSGLNGVGENRGEVLYGTLNDFSLGNRQMIPMETIVCSLTAMSRKYGYPIDGMLGYDFFAKGKIYLNLVKKEMGICFKQEISK
jgi:predicted aspartyl protease